MQIGYARVSTREQELTLQEDALQRAGCEKIFTDVASGASSSREGLAAALEFLREGDVLIVWRLDRLGRSLRHLLETVHGLETRRIGFKSLSEALDTTSSGGKFFFQVFGALAEFERNLIRDRTQAGLSSARARGRRGGRPKALDQESLAVAKTLHASRENSVAEICRTLGISRTTFYRSLKLNPAPTSSQDGQSHAPSS
jgi:DNA invertase Pin-like site-specific DNA recombinase